MENVLDHSRFGILTHYQMQLLHQPPRSIWVLNPLEAQKLGTPPQSTHLLTVVRSKYLGYHPLVYKLQFLQCGEELLNNKTYNLKQM